MLTRATCRAGRLARPWARPPARGRPKADLAFLKQHVDLMRANLTERRMSGEPERVVALYDAVNERRREADALRSERKQLGRDDRERGRALKARLKELDAQLREDEEEMAAAAAHLPNWRHPDAPVGGDEAARVVRTVGAPPAPGAAPRSYREINELHGFYDLEHAGRVAGSKFATLRGEGALLELALAQWALLFLRERGYEPSLPPDLVRHDVIAGCGFQPRDGEATQIYHVAGSDLCLAGTGELPLAGSLAGQLLAAEDLPIRAAAFTHCFRTEAGAGGRAAKGLFRLHQFSKVEMFQWVAQEDSDAALERMVDTQVELLAALGLHLRVLDMPSEELGAPAWRKFDVEAWMPSRGEGEGEGQGGAFAEVCSASNCTDYQSRRLNTRYRAAGERRTHFAHTLNATAIAVPRVIIALVETHQTPDGNVRVPEVLRGMLGGRELLF